MKIQVDPGAYPPTRAHPTDAGLDIRAAEGCIVRSHSSKNVKTGIHIQLPEGTCGILMSKSGLMTTKALTTTGLIDEGYTGEIIVSVFNHSDEDYMIFAGDMITQIVIVNCRYEPITEIVSKIDGGERGNDGFGSTGV